MQGTSPEPHHTQIVPSVCRSDRDETFGSGSRARGPMSAASTPCTLISGSVRLLIVAPICLSGGYGQMMGRYKGHKGYSV